MTIGPHIDPEALGGIEELPQSHPDRRHVESCARCQAARAAYRAFLEPPDRLPASERAAARARLTAARDSPASRRADGVKTMAEAGRARWWSRPALRPIWAGSAGVIIVAVLYFAGGDRLAGRDAVRLRGTAPEDVGTAGGSAPSILEATRDRGGAFRLRWRAVPGADAYRVTLFSARLEVIARHDAGSDTSLVLPAGEVPDGAGGALYWQVAALRDGDETATSPMIPVDAR